MKSKKLFETLRLRKALALILVAVSLLLVSCGDEAVSSSMGDVSSESSQTVSGSSNLSEEASENASSGDSSSSDSSENAESSENSESAEESKEESSKDDMTTEADESSVASDASEDAPEAPSEDVSEETSQSPAQGVGDKNASTAKLDKIPEYSGTDYISINNGIPYFTAAQLTSKGYEKYGDLDSLGRCTSAIASVGKDTMPTGDRGSISSVKPTGWIQAKYSCIKTEDLYNRSHLIAWALSGENANKQNLVTGTAHLNQDVMTKFEDMILDYIKETGNHVAYRVTPLFKGNDLVCRGIQMEAYSVEDKGAGICFNVYCYNVQPGVVIDYATGKSHAEGGSDTSEDESKADDTQTADYVLNIKSKKIHLPDCGSVSTMSEKNKKAYTGTIEDLISEGYTRCGSCLAG